MRRVYFCSGVPVRSCALVVAHDFLHSGKHSALLFCSSPFGLVHSYMHLLRQASNSGSFLVPLIDGSVSLAQVVGGAAIANAIDFAAVMN